MTIPKANEIEVTVFGPGYGECIVVHVGSGKWAIVDSCLDDDFQPASISYLSDLGVAVDTDVISVSASHWHDDHIKGLAKTVALCSNAKLSLGAALRHSEFVAFLQAHEDQPVQKLDRGGSELLACLNIVRDRKASVKLLSEDTLIFDFDPYQLAHQLRVEMRALSPSGKQFTDFLRRIRKFPTASEGNPKGRITEPSRNHLSVAMLLTVGKQAVLLGADLEQMEDPQKGWKAVVAGRRGRLPLAHLFKVPHHGSCNAHNEDVWDEMLDEPVSIVTPWIKGGHHLPRKSDLDRLRTRSSKCLLTSTKKIPTKKRYGTEVMKLIDAAKVELDTSIYSGGRVTIRWIPNVGLPSIQLSGGAISV